MGTRPVGGTPVAPLKSTVPPRTWGGLLCAAASVVPVRLHDTGYLAGCGGRHLPGTDFRALAQVAPSLLGQMVFREMRAESRYPRLYPVFEQVKAMEAYGYWNREGIPAPFNGFLPKGEIGVNLAYPRGSYTVWVAETCARGLLHPVRELDVAFAPRLADLRATALGKAAFLGTTETAAH